MPASSTAVAKLQKHWTNIAHHLYLKHECPVPLPAGDRLHLKPLGAMWQTLLAAMHNSSMLMGSVMTMSPYA
jgi:hypothetical protein